MIINLLNNNKLPNIMKNKYCILCVKNHLLKIMKNVAVGILESRACYFLSQLDFCRGILQQKKQHFFYGRFVFNNF